MNQGEYLDTVARVFRPARDGLAVARAVTAGISDPRAAWDALLARCALPEAFRADTGRCFFRAVPCPACSELRARNGEYVWCARCAGAGVIGAESPWPPTLAAAVTLAGDAAGVAAAEAWMREAAARQGRATAQSFPAVWHVLPREAAVRALRDRSYDPRKAIRALDESARGAAFRKPAASVRREVLQAMRAAHGYVALCSIADDVGNAVWWDLADRHGAVPAAQRGRNPFAPLVEIARLGYGVRWMGDAGGLLVAPEAAWVDGLGELVEHLERDGRAPREWWEAHAPSGSLAMCWAESVDVRAVLRAGSVGADAKAAVGAACACFDAVLPAAMAGPRGEAAARMVAETARWARGEAGGADLERACRAAFDAAFAQDDTDYKALFDVARFAFDPNCQGASGPAVARVAAASVEHFIAAAVRASGPVDGSVARWAWLGRLAQIARHKLPCPPPPSA